VHEAAIVQVLREVMQNPESAARARITPAQNRLSRALKIPRSAFRYRVFGFVCFPLLNFPFIVHPFRVLCHAVALGRRRILNS